MVFQVGKVVAGAGDGLREGDAHVLRNAGGVITDDVIRSLAVSQRRLGTREVMLIHHTDCGMQSLTDDGIRADVGYLSGDGAGLAYAVLANWDPAHRDATGAVLTAMRRIGSALARECRTARS